MDSENIRKKYLDFFNGLGNYFNDSRDFSHSIIPSASFFPENDATTLFVGSGMQPLVPFLLGQKHPEGKRLANVQKSFRAEDIEEIGDGRHNTFFEMLGNWSLGDYFKQEQLHFIFDFLVKEVGLDPKKLYATCFSGNEEIGIPKDTEASGIWKELFKSVGIDAKEENNPEENGLGEARIFFYGEKKNWWSRSGLPVDMPEGEPGGPDSEIFFDLGSENNFHEKSKFCSLPCHVNCDCGRFIEIGNNVFMTYKKQNGKFEILEQKNIDFGGGLERIVIASQGMTNIYETDVFLPIIEKISSLSGRAYRENKKPFEVIADHLKASVFLLGDERRIGPSNLGQGYVLRRLIRRAIRFGKMIGVTESGWIVQVAEEVIKKFGEAYPELIRNQNFIKEQLFDEEKKFKEALDKGLKEFEKMAKVGTLSGKEAFYLYQTYGFPLEITKELADEAGISFDENEFKVEMEKHQELSRTLSAGKFKGGLAEASGENTKLHTATHLLLTALRQVLGEDIRQKGSNITPERLRFDFNYGEKLTEVQKKEIEDIVNNAISQAMEVDWEEIDKEEAFEKGALGSFEEKYGEKVKVYTISKGEKVLSKEICGGPHVQNTSVLGRFKIIKEESAGAGIRRIKAVLEA